MRMFDQVSGTLIRRLGLPRTMVAMAALVLALTQCPGAASARDAFADDAYATYKADTGNGKYLFNASGCGACHGSARSSDVLSADWNGTRRSANSMPRTFRPMPTASPGGPMRSFSMR